MSSVLLATCTDLPHGDEDADALLAALTRCGVGATWAAWTDPDVDWDSGLVVLRSTWDYTRRRPEFLDWLTRVPRAANDAAVVAWNSDKVYLRDLAAAGVPIVPTSFARPGEAVDLPDAPEFVIKPSVGAGSRGVGRFAADQHAQALGHAAALQAAGRTVLVQPYLGRVDTAGETALVYVDGRFSHAIRKGPMLPGAVTHDVEGDELYVQEHITARTPQPAELQVGAAVLGAVRDLFGSDQLYARVDLLPSDAGPVVVELELVEPSLFLGYGPDDPADTFAAAIAARL
jgi:hypothetical protein